GNSLIICDTKEYLQMILEEIDRIDRPSAGLCVETVTLKFLEAKNLKKAIDNMSSQSGSIATNDSTNSLIICDTRDRLDQIIAEIRKADQTPRQIMIEVVIMDVQLEDDTEIGVNWDSVLDRILDLEYKQTLVDTLAGTATAGGDLSIVKASMSGTIHALQEKRNVEILASPRVLVVSGQEASIRTIEEIPYTELTGTAEGGAQALTSTEFKEVGVTLRVKATITDDDKILMTVQPEQSVKTGESINNVPVVDTRAISTSLLVEDGQVVVMGGLRRKETRITDKKVPLLGDLPVIGFFFSGKKEEISNSELVILLSPHIHKGEAVPEEVMKKWNTLRDRPMLTLPGKDDPANDPLSVLNLF
ncbi:MAG TPA: secretin N-terminal domain-containing protein, partial [Sedimentisphaerales bacterium]|nr:secretin N-terminal domain-containing protein [Sedimentisphaerales bacterium]